MDCANFGYQNIPNSWKYKRFVTLNSPLLRNSDTHGLLPGLAASIKDLAFSNLPRIIDGKTVRWGFFMPCGNGLKFVSKLVTEEKVRE